MGDKLDDEGMAGKCARGGSGFNGVVERRSFDSNEQTQRTGKPMAESCESIEIIKACATDADGDVSFSSYLLEGEEEEEAGRSSKGSDLVDDQSKELQGINEVTFPVPQCRGTNSEFHRVELGQGSEWGLSAAQSGQKKIAAEFNDIHEDLAITSKKVDGKIYSVCAYPYPRVAPDEDQIIGPNATISMQKQTSCGKRVPVVGRHAKDAEISIFDAERYFSVREEKEVVALNEGTRIHSHTEKTARENRRGKTRSKPKGLSSDMLLDARSSRTPRISAVSSVDGSRGCSSGSFRGTPTASSEASWNSRSGLLSKGGTLASFSVQSSPSNVARKTTRKWRFGGFGCKCPCSNRKSVEIDDKITEARRTASVPNSVVSSRLSSPLGSAKYRISGLHSIVSTRLSRSANEKLHRDPSLRNDENNNRNDGSENDYCPGITGASQFKLLSNGKELIQARRDPRSLDASGDPQHSDTNSMQDAPVTLGINLASSATSNHHLRIASGKWKSSGAEDEIPTYVPQSEQCEERRHNDGGRRIRTPLSKSISLEKDADGFSFPILQPCSPTRVKSEESARSSLEVFGSAFPDNIEETRKPSEFDRQSMNIQRQSTDLHRRLMLFSLEKARKSFTLPAKYPANSLQESDNTFAVEDAAAAPGIENSKTADAESDSSSDLFEIESLSTQGTAYYTVCNRRRDSLESHNLDDISASSYAASDAAPNSFHFHGIHGETVTPSGQSSCYEPSEVSVDWSITTGDTMDKAASSDYEERKMIKMSGLKSVDVNFKANSTRNRRTGIFGCRSEKAVSAAMPNPVRSSSSYNYYKQHHRRRLARRISGATDHQNLPLWRVKLQAESGLTGIGFPHNMQRSASTTKRSLSRSRFRSRSAHYSHYSQETH